jgi:hypothetical protein
MNRWRQRLDELQGEGRGNSCAFPNIVQNFQNVQKPPPDLSFEHLEQIAQLPENAAASAAPAIWGGAEDERAAILEHDGNIPHA